MGTRCLTVADENKEILCMYRQMDGYPSGHGKELKEAFKGFRITNGISGDKTNSANGMGCLAAQIVAKFKDDVGGIYLYASGEREVGEEYVYSISEKDGRIWLDVLEGEVAFFGLPGTKPELMEWIYHGWLDDFEPEKCGQIYHAA